MCYIVLMGMIQAQGGRGTLVLNEGVLYGITNMGGAENMGTLFKLNTDGSGYLKLYDFDHLTSTPFQSLAIDGNTLYGTTRDDYNARGRIFSINTDGEDFQIIFSFNGENGREPSSPLTVRDGFLYGTTLGGGFIDKGVLFKIRTNGDDFTILKDDFDAELSFMPTGNLVVLDNTIYGAALQGGSHGCGLIYKVNTDGSMYEELADFGVLTGCNPNGLTHYESALYGMTSIGGNADGVIFKVDLVDHSFTLLHKFNKFDGANPDAALTVINDQLFGYANNGEFNYGVVFSIDPDGNNFTIVKHLEGTNTGYYPEGSVVVTPSLCYGFTRGGGLYNSGLIYSIDPDGQNYQVLHSFFPQDGAIPTAQ